MNQPFNQHSFNALLAEHKLMAARCCTCRAIFVPPRPMCADCTGTQMEWTALSGRGRLKTFTSISIVAPAMAALGYGRKRPYCTGVVALEEDCSVVARIEGVDATAPETIQVGAMLQAKFVVPDPAVDPQTVLVFEPVTTTRGRS